VDTRSEGLSDQGRRKNNEDFIAYFEPTDPAELKNYGSLYIVADGVGGAAKGERASQYAAQKTLFDYYQPYEADLDAPEQPILIEPLGYLRSIMKRVNEEIYEYATQNGTRMATTIVAAVVRDGFLYITNVGDSRAYLIRDGAATPINRDHSLVGEMVEHGEMTEAEAMASSIKNRLTRSLGGDPEVTVDGYPPLQLQNGDKVLLCSDGLTRYASQEDIASMTATGTPEEIAKDLVKFANDSGGADNVSVIVISYQPHAMEMTIPIRRPQDVDLETLSSKSAAPPSAAQSNFPISQNLLLFSVTAGIILIMVTAIGIAAIVMRNKRNTANVNVKQTASAVVVPIIISTTPTLSLTSTNIPEPTQIILSPPPAAAVTPVTSSQPAYVSGCIAAVNDGGALNQILIQFKLQPVVLDDDKNYEYCKMENDQCVTQGVLPSSEIIQPDWWIILPEITTKDICESYKGTWMQP